MARRRSISVAGLTHQRLKGHCQALGVSMSGYVERLVARAMDDAGEPVPGSVDSPMSRGPSVKEQHISQYFTF